MGRPLPLMVAFGDHLWTALAIDMLPTLSKHSDSGSFDTDMQVIMLHLDCYYFVGILPKMSRNHVTLFKQTFM